MERRVRDSEMGFWGGSGPPSLYQAGVPGREVPHPDQEGSEPKPERLGGRGVKKWGELN